MVGDERIRQLLLLGEQLVLAGWIERCADDDRADGVECWASITEALGLERSTRCCCPGIPPQDHPGSDQIGEPAQFAMLIGQ
jgi:hypothetical protein